MTEADLTNQLIAMSDMFFTSVSVLFTIVSAYIVGLYWFLRKTNRLLKIITFGFFTFTLIIFGIFAFGSFRHAHGINIALLDLAEKTQLSPLGQMATESTALNVYTFTVVGVLILGLMIYGGLMYLTFFYKWDSEK